MTTSGILRTWFIALLSLSILTVGLSFRRTREPASQAHSMELVPVASRDEIKELIRQGKRVIFIDAREKQEFQEEHLPGAINMTLRDISTAKLDQLTQADVAIAYCLKDFRGFEVAKSLREAGISHAKIMQPYGLNGWKADKLPVAASAGMPEFEALQRLVVWSKQAR